MGEYQYKPEPRDWFCKTAGPAAPSGLSDAARNQPARVWTARKGCASHVGTFKEPREASGNGGNASRIVTNSSAMVG